MREKAKLIKTVCTKQTESVTKKSRCEFGEGGTEDLRKVPIQIFQSSAGSLVN